MVKQPYGSCRRRYTKEELAQRGQALYESKVRQQVESGNKGKIVAIDIETGSFEVADKVLAATKRLFERYPNAQPWVIRIGYRAVYHFGARTLSKDP
ncbi:MAG: hypothetical protein AAGC54_13825 [Cyanobacteria bacterium P01_F01_bin.4]